MCISGHHKCDLSGHEGTNLHEIISLRIQACFEPLFVNFPATQPRSRLPHLRILRLLRKQTISHPVSKELNISSFQGVFPMSSSLHKQSQRHILVFSKPNYTNMITMILHNHAVLSKIKQQQTSHVLLVFRATWTNNYTAMKSYAHFLISD